MGACCCSAGAATTMPIPLVLPSLLRGGEGTGREGGRLSLVAEATCPQRCMRAASMQPWHATVARNRGNGQGHSRPTPEHEACAGGEVLRALQEAEAHARAVARPVGNKWRRGGLWQSARSPTPRPIPGRNSLARARCSRAAVVKPAPHVWRSTTCTLCCTPHASICQAAAAHRRRSRSMATTRADCRTISQWMTA